jgi:hypothetical protein
MCATGNWTPNFQQKFSIGPNKEREMVFTNTDLHWAASISFKIWGQIDLFFRLEQSLNAVLTKSTKIIGFSYTYAFDKKKN